MVLVGVLVVAAYGRVRGRGRRGVIPALDGPAGRPGRLRTQVRASAKTRGTCCNCSIVPRGWPRRRSPRTPLRPSRRKPAERSVCAASVASGAISRARSRCGSAAADRRTRDEPVAARPRHAGRSPRRSRSSLSDRLDGVRKGLVVQLGSRPDPIRAKQVRSTQRNDGRGRRVAAALGRCGAAGQDRHDAEQRWSMDRRRARSCIGSVITQSLGGNSPAAAEQTAERGH